MPVLLGAIREEQRTTYEDFIAAGPRVLPELRLQRDKATTPIGVVSAQVQGTVESEALVRMTATWTRDGQTAIFIAGLQLVRKEQIELFLIDFRQDAITVIVLEPQDRTEIGRLVWLAIKEWSNQANPIRELYRQVSQRRKEHKEDADRTIADDGLALAKEWEDAAYGPEGKDKRSFDRLIMGHINPSWLVRATDYLVRTSKRL